MTVSDKVFQSFRDETRTSLGAVNADIVELRSEIGELRTELRSFAIDIRFSVQRTSKWLETVDDRLSETDQRFTGSMFGLREEFHREQLDLRSGLKSVNDYVEKVEMHSVDKNWMAATQSRIDYWASFQADIQAKIDRLDKRNPKLQLSRDYSYEDMMRKLEARGFGKGFDPNQPLADFIREVEAKTLALTQKIAARDKARADKLKGNKEPSTK